MHARGGKRLRGGVVVVQSQERSEIKRACGQTQPKHSHGLGIDQTDSNFISLSLPPPPPPPPPLFLLPMRARGLTPALNVYARYTESDSCICCARWSVDGPYSGGVATLSLSLVNVARLSLVMRRCSKRLRAIHRV
jgi:hypothetical protein